MKRAVLFFVLASAAVIPAAADTVAVEIQGARFRPADSAFREIYGSGAAFGVQFDLKIWGGLGFWATGGRFKRDGALTLTGETTTITLTPLAAGVRYALGTRGLTTYIGLGFGFVRYREESPLGKVDEGDFGFVGQAGFLIGLVGPLFADLQARYTKCVAEPAGVKADLGGFQAGLGLGLRF
jgi:hypothetical protein